MRIYVGNLPYTSTDDSLRELFSQYGQVESVDIVTDRSTGQSKGFGFVEMPAAAEAQAAITALNGKDLQGRALTVNEARPREDRGGSRGGGGYGGGRSSGGGGGGRYR
jgi:RNA recognition motif-containing protein